MSKHTPISTTIKRLCQAILIILYLSNLLTGCSTGETIDQSKESISDLYVFRQASSGVPYKTSLVSGVASTVLLTYCVCMMTIVRLTRAVISASHSEDIIASCAERFPLCKVQVCEAEKTSCVHIITVTESEPREIKWNNEVYYDLYGGKIYRMNLDGSDAKLLCTLDCIDLSVALFTPFLGYHAGNLALAFMDKVENSSYESGYAYNTSPDVILLHTEDLTWEISEN